jgi:hypothetical protein
MVWLKPMLNSLERSLPRCEGLRLAIPPSRNFSDGSASKAAAPDPSSATVLRHYKRRKTASANKALSPAASRADTGAE